MARLASSHGSDGAASAAARADGPAPGSTICPATACGLPAVVVLDTCVLISHVLRALLLRLADKGCFRPAWSRVIGDEWRRNAARLWAVPPEETAAQWDALQMALPDADLGEVAAFKEGLRYSDPKDWHVVAAARAALARWPGEPTAVLTRNLKDFDRRELRGLGLALYGPDPFLECCWHQCGVPLRQALGELEQELRLAEGSPSLDQVLGRERLYRLRKLWRQAGAAGAGERDGAPPG